MFVKEYAGIAKEIVLGEHDDAIFADRCGDRAKHFGFLVISLEDGKRLGRRSFRPGVGFDVVDKKLPAVGKNQELSADRIDRQNRMPDIHSHGR